MNMKGFLGVSLKKGAWIGKKTRGPVSATGRALRAIWPRLATICGLLPLLVGATWAAEPPGLVRDVGYTAAGGFPKNFRSTQDLSCLKSGSAVNLVGLPALRVAGCSVFTAAQLSKMLEYIPGPVTVFDLRQEEHIYINGYPFNLNRGPSRSSALPSHDAIVAYEAERANALALGSTVTFHDKHAKHDDENLAGLKSMTVVDAETERKLVKDEGAAYVRLTVKDGGLPTDAEVDRFIEAVRRMPRGDWALFHCQAGHGRTTRFMACYDMLRNARDVSLKDILSRQSLLLGSSDLLLSEGGKGGQKQAFFREFYRYAQANPDGRPQLWTEWLKTSQP